MRLVYSLIGAGLLLSVLAILFPVLAPYFDDGRRAAYRQVLGFHVAGHAPRDFGVNGVGRGQQPFLYLSWFPKDDPRHADELAVYPSGHVYGRRVLWNYAIQGWGEQASSPTSFTLLQKLAPLPSGLSSPDDLPYSRLLIVSQAQAGGWRTLFYDRKSLPPAVQQMIRTSESTGASVGTLATP